MSETSTLRFCRELYAGEAVDEALGLFGPHASFSRTHDDDHWVVVVAPLRPGAAWRRQLCGELQNCALGLTVRRGTQGEPR